MTRQKPPPTTERNARRSLKFEDAEGRIIVGSNWFRPRIIADTKEQAIACALRVWREMRGA